MAGMKNLGGKTALITGASSGIGREFARQLATMGTNLILAGRDEDRLKTVADEITSRHGNKVKLELVAQDLATLEAPQELFNTIRQKELTVDILINNAGFGRVTHYEEEPYEKICAMNMLNMVNPSLLCRLFIPGMLSRGEGGVINVASTAAFQPLPFMSNYAATKSYLLTLSLGLWEEYRGRGVTITAFCPGNVRSGFQEVANMPQKPLLRFPVVDPDIVVNDAIWGFMEGEPLVIPRVHLNFLQFGLGKFIPLKMKLKIAADLYR